MTMTGTIKGALLATTVAGMFGCASTPAQPTTQAATSGEVKCEGVNECKGHGACSGATNQCSGHNECKGKGWVKTASKEDCESKGGKTL